ncbi:MAG: glycosyl transferase [Tannerella sp.]|jgi:hypothetical protein|nr:glycosyl transferase [Tannerella sp.]
MKHAYLIIAHNEFEVLKKLLQAIDDPRNDVFIHFDRKVKQIPAVEMQHANLFIIANRINVHWGHVSQIEAEYALFEAAYRSGKYAYHHLISGTHMPLYSQNHIHRFFENMNKREVLAYMYTDAYEINLKLQRYNFFVKNFAHPAFIIRHPDQWFWKLGIRIQRIFNIHRNKNILYRKAANWVSITGHCVAFLIAGKDEILKRYRFSFCGDEFFVPSKLEWTSEKWNVIDCDRLIKTDIMKSASRYYRMEDFDELIHSGCLFARKFGSEDMKVVDQILNHIKSMQ